MKKFYPRFIITALLTALLIPFTQAQKPNIIVIFTDDQSFNSIAYTGGDVFTPCIDSLAAEGMKFTNAHHATTVCSPSRYTLLTGKYAGRCRAESFMEKFPLGNPTRVENNVELRKDEAHLGNILQQNGYRTGFVGKSHITEHDILNINNWPSYGLQTYGLADDPYNPTVSSKMRHNHTVYQEIIRSYGFDYADGIYMANVKELRNDALNIHNLEWTVDKARKFIEQEKDNPFFLYFSTTLHHGPVPWAFRDGKFWSGLDADPKLTGEGYVDTTWGFMPTRGSIIDTVEARGYPANTAYAYWLDAGVRSIYEQVVDMGIEDNTLIIFMPDHGMWRHGKATLYDYGTKVPMFMYWKGSLISGSEYDGLVQSIDFAPTILDLAGATFPGDTAFDGLSLKSILETGTGTAHESLFAEFGYARSVKTEKWKYIAVRYPDDVQDKIDQGYKWTAFNGGLIDLPYLCNNSHLGYHASRNNPLYFELDQLFDLENDYEETVNVYEQNPEVVAQMKALLSGYLKDFENRPFGEFTFEASDPPQRASYPEPRSTTEDVDNQNVELKWTAGGGASSHDVYFGTTNPPPFIGNQSGTSYNAGNLEASTTYYWRVDEVNGNGTTTGNTWSFNTLSGYLLLPFRKYIYSGMVNNEIRDQDFEIVNEKEQSVGISSISIAGNDASFFEILEDVISGTDIGPGATKSFSLRYQPGTSGGNHTAFAIVTSEFGNDTIELRSEDVSNVYRMRIDQFDEIGGWTSQNAMSLHNQSHREGGASLEVSGQETREYQKNFSTPLRSLATEANAYLRFHFYVSDVSKYLSNNQVEISSGGKNDVDEYNWNLHNKLSNGWNRITLKFSQANVTPSGASPDLGNINFIRIYHGKTAPITVRIDGMFIIDSTVTAPAIASNPIPFHNSTSIHEQMDLSWSTDSKTSSAYVYFGTDDPPPFLEENTGNTYSLPELESNTTYFWRIDARNEAGITAGETWSFTTRKNTTSSADLSSTDPSFSLLPNPSTGMVRIKLPIRSDNVIISILDLNGRSLLQQSTRNNEIALNLSGFRRGIYIVRVGNSNNVSTRMLVLE